MLFTGVKNMKTFVGTKLSPTELLCCMRQGNYNITHKQIFLKLRHQYVNVIKNYLVILSSLNIFKQINAKTHISTTFNLSYTLFLKMNYSALIILNLLNHFELS